MTKILIDPERIKRRIEQWRNTVPAGNQDKRVAKKIAIEELELVLKQGEEYNENESIEFAEWVVENRYILQFSEKYNEERYHQNDTQLMLTDEEKWLNSFYTIEELYKLYKNERKIT